ncbi:MarC family NAAT transporter [Cytophagaceae bacterium ABcell3]|nr:MarC family NAAT transporter [Cytophagaceae bacterium ABcell3]
MELILATIAALLPIINPFSTAPMFLSITPDYTEEERSVQAWQGVVYMTFILVTFLIGGTFIINFFGLSVPGMRIAGGIIVFGVGMGMLKPKDELGPSKAEVKEASKKKDISFTPLAMPSLSGPGSISVIIGLSSLTVNIIDYIFITVGILVVSLIVFITLRSSSKLVKFLGVNGLNAMTKIMGFIILCVGVQFIVNGVLDILTGREMADFLQRVQVGSTPEQ